MGALPEHQERIMSNALTNTAAAAYAAIAAEIPCDAEGMAQFCANLPERAHFAPLTMRECDSARAIAEMAEHYCSVIRAARRPIPLGGYDTATEAARAFSRAKDHLRECARAGAQLLARYTPPCSGAALADPGDGF